MKRPLTSSSLSFVAVAGLTGLANVVTACSSGDIDVLVNEDANVRDTALVTTACDNEKLLSGCFADACKVSATGFPLPPGAALRVTKTAVPPALTGDALGPVLCSIDVLGASSPVENLTLSISLKPSPPSAALLFAYATPTLSELVPASSASRDAVVGLVTAPGTFGATVRPGPWSLAGTAGVDVSASATQAELLQNLSSNGFGGSFFDGTHLFVSNGARVLIYEGIPANPAVHPSVVLGQPDLDVIEPQTSSSLFGVRYGASGLWSDGQRLVVTHGNRILIWNTMPTANLTPADVVLGQPDFEGNSANTGGVAATSLSAVTSVDSDGTRLAATDLENNRVLVWNTFPTAVDQPADLEIGQPGFTTNSNSAGAIPIYQAWGVAFDAQGLFLTGGFGPGLVHVPESFANNPTSDFTALAVGLSPPNALGFAGATARLPGGGLATCDPGLARVAVLRSPPEAAAPAIDFVLGQPDTTRVVESLVTGSVVSSSAEVPPRIGAGSVVSVSDSDRVLIFDTPPSYNFEPASRVIGQAGFSTNGVVDYRGISASTLAGPADVAASGATLAVADRGNNRVLLFATAGIRGNGAGASLILGQPNATSYVPNVDQATPSATTLSGPAGVALDGTHVIVADSENHRVLIWNTVPTTSGVPADVVLGQTGFSGRRPNSGRGDENGDGFSDAGPDGFFYPMGVASDGAHLFVVDRMNHRVLGWTSFPTSNGQAADLVLGQPDFASGNPNAGNGAYVVAANGLDLPSGATLVGTSLWIADTENNRLVRWDDVTTTPKPAVAVGQVSLTSLANPNYQLPGASDVGFRATPPTTSTSVLRPRAVVVSRGVLFATEMDSNRVHMFDATSFAPLGELGQTSDSGATADRNGVTAATMSLPLGVSTDGANLWVADSGNHRVVAYSLASAPSPASTGASATLILGQVSLLTNGFNQSSTAANGATSMPYGLAMSGDQLFVADTGNSRVLRMGTPVVAGNAPLAVYGQPNGTLALPNAGGSPSSATLAAPRGVFADTTHVIIADTGNNRVLVYPPGGSTSATLVLGQPNFASVAPNVGGASASTMQAPAGVFSDGVALWVADTGNHRVLVWKRFPTTNGQPADIVLGQRSFAGTLGNEGGSLATATSLSFPSDVRVVNGVLYVADSGNNRLVYYRAAPASSGTADGVLGQHDLTSRVAAVDPTDLTHLAGPVALASDAENLYVADRDLGRAVVYHLGDLASGSAAAFPLGAAGGLALSGPSGIAAQATGFFTSRVYVSNTASSEIEVLASVDRLADPK